jgi:tetratricopeptide (TPR) repeat protein
MASKNKKRDGRATVPLRTGREEVEHLIAKQRLKEAVHEAKLCYKQASTPEHHRLLERAYLLRSDQLRRNGMAREAQEVAQHLLAFGLTDSALTEEASRLLLALGLSRSAQALHGRTDSPEVQERFARQEADLAVLHPERAVEVPPAIRQGAAPVRAALEALQTGDEAEALEILRDVARSSPFSDWKLFVRGLAAFSRSADAEARANWDRLDPERGAARIVRGLLALNATSAHSEPRDEPGSAVASKLHALEKRIFGEPVLEALEQLRTFVAQDRWDDAVRRLASLRFRIQRIEPKLAQRLTHVLYGPLLRTTTQRDEREALALAKEFVRVAEPLPIDPRWNRFWGLFWEGPHGSLDDVENAWQRYLKDLENLPGLKPEERTLARAMVLKHLGEQCIEVVEDLAHSTMGFGPPPATSEIREEKRHAIAWLEESVKLAPNHRPTYKLLLSAYSHWNQPEQAATAARRLLQQFPDDFDTLMFLAKHHYSREEPEPALETIQRARALKPLDQKAAHREWGVHILRARVLAIKGRFDEGRAEFAAAEHAWPEGSNGVLHQARLAVFELKAGESERAETLIADGLKHLPEATSFWLALNMEAIRYALPKDAQRRFETHWTSAMTKKIRSDTAGALASLMSSYLVGEIDYSGRAGHIKHVVDYLRRTTRIKYQANHLKEACLFLKLVPKERDLHEKLLNRGLKLFPDKPLYHFLAGELELEKGPFGGGDPWYARTHLEKALALANASKDRDDAELVPNIQQSLSLLKDLVSGPMGLPMPFPGPGSGSGPFSGRGGPASFRAAIDAMSRMMGYMPGDFDDDDDDDDWDEDNDFGEEPPPRSPARGGKKKKK